jgi:hypothetical protein
MVGRVLHPRWIVGIVVWMGLLLFPPWGYAEGNVPLSEPVWTQGEVGNGVGSAGLLIADVDSDGTADTLTCSTDSPFLYQPDPQQPSRYKSVWYGERVACSAIAVGDINADGLLELVVGSRTPLVYIYQYDTLHNRYQRTTTLTLTGIEGVSDIEVGDVDSDNTLELVVTRQSATTIYDARTLSMEWNATGLGGTHVKIGDVDGNDTLDIVVNGAIGYILSASTQSIRHTKPDGWGRVIEVGDSDADGRAEIAYVRGDTVATSWVGVEEIENGTLQSKWEVGLGYAEWVTIGEVDTGVSGAEVVVGGNVSNDAIAARNGVNGNMLWTMNNPGSGVQGMGIGDSNSDGVADIWWGSGLTSTASDQLLVADNATRAISWRNRDYEGPFFTAAGDMDADGIVEIVALSTTLNDGNSGGVYLPYDGVTFGEELTHTTQVVASAFVLGQVDEDAVLELVMGGQLHGTTSAYVEVIDATTRQPQWTRSNLGNGKVSALKAVNIDQDIRAELFIAAPNRRVYVHDGASNITEWEGGPFTSPIVDLEIADADNDGILELGVLTQENLYIYSTASWALETTIPVNQDGFTGSQVAAGNEDSGGAGEWFIAAVRPLTGTVPYESRLRMVDGSTYAQQWETLLPGITVVELLTRPGDANRAGRLYLGGYQQLSEVAEQPTYLTIADYDPTGLTERYSNSEFWGNLYAMSLTDTNGDGVSELFIGTSTLYQLRSTEPPEPTAVTITTIQGNSASQLSWIEVGVIGVAMVGLVLIRKWGGTGLKHPR